jgi:hypothetical protein
MSMNLTAGATAVQESVQVGGVRVPLDTACAWVSEYTDAEANRSGKHPYAYPAYDTYQGGPGTDGSRGSGAPAGGVSRVVLSDGDLLAPVLLNVPVKIRSFYGLQRVRGQLEEALAHPDLAVPLVSITDPERVRAMVAPLYTVLDGQDRPWRVKATTLSKVLHRKRPQSVVLHDKWLRACYVGDGRPVPPAERRTWAEYMGEITIAVGNDLRTQPEAFTAIEAAVNPTATLSRVRLLDILAWKSQGTPRPDAADTTNLP